MATTKSIKFYEDSISFWHRMGIQKEDHLIALSLADLITAKLASAEDLKIWHEYYKNIAEKCISTISNPIFDHNRGRECFLIQSGL